MTPEVEIFSATDPVCEPNRRVWYWLEFDGKKSQRRNDWATINAWALALLAEHNACLIDRSDKDSGFLLSTLG